jgi:hypothetical protein
VKVSWRRIEEEEERRRNVKWTKNIKVLKR